jgi:hypothetical protein
MMKTLLRIIGSVAIAAGSATPALTAMIKTHADASITENGAGVGNAVSGGNGTSTGSINVRWNFGAAADRNEWGAYKFDLSSIANKSAVQNVKFNAYMHRANSNNSGRNLHLYAITPGAAGEDWPEATITYASMPGFTFDMNAATNVLAVGTTLTDLGAFLLPASPALDAERSLATVAPLLAGSDVLTSLVQGMGTNNLLTILVSYQTSSNGTWNTITREATQSTTAGLGTFAAGDFASFLSFDVVVPEPTSLMLLAMAIAVTGLARRRIR